MTKRTLAANLGLAILPFCLLAACARSPSTTAGLSGLPAGLALADTADQLGTWIADLSADQMEGRGPGTPGDVDARRYIADAMAGMGLEPAAADGGWEQPFDIVGIDAAVPETWTFVADGGDSVEFAFRDEFIAHSGVQSEQAALENAEVVFVGYGIQAPEYDWDDFGDADLAGKVLVMLNNDPDWDPDLFEGERRLYYGRWTYKYESAAARGAAGAIIIHTTPSAGYPFQVVQTSWTGPQFELPAEGESRTQINAWLTEEASRRLFALAGVDYDETLESARSADFTPVPLGLTTSLSLANTVTREQTANVLGALPAATRISPTSGSSSPPTTTIWGSRRTRVSTTGSTTALSTTRPASPRCLPRRASWPPRIRGRAAPSCSLSSVPRSRVCSGPRTTPPTRPCRPGRWPPTSTTTAATGGAAPAT